MRGHTDAARRVARCPYPEGPAKAVASVKPPRLIHQVQSDNLFPSAIFTERVPDVPAVRDGMTKYFCSACLCRFVCSLIRIKVGCSRGWSGSGANQR